VDNSCQLESHVMDKKLSHVVGIQLTRAAFS
jgi:hypothetical protein